MTIQRDHLMTLLHAAGIECDGGPTDYDGGPLHEEQADALLARGVRVLAPSERIFDVRLLDPLVELLDEENASDGHGPWATEVPLMDPHHDTWLEDPNGCSLQVMAYDVAELVNLAVALAALDEEADR